MTVVNGQHFELNMPDAAIGLLPSWLETRTHAMVGMIVKTRANGKAITDLTVSEAVQLANGLLQAAAEASEKEAARAFDQYVRPFLVMVPGDGKTYVREVSDMPTPGADVSAKSPDDKCARCGDLRKNHDALYGPGTFSERESKPETKPEPKPAAAVVKPKDWQLIGANGQQLPTFAVGWSPMVGGTVVLKACGIPHAYDMDGAVHTERALSIDEAKRFANMILNACERAESMGSAGVKL